MVFADADAEILHPRTKSRPSRSRTEASILISLFFQGIFDGVGRVIDDPTCSIRVSSAIQPDIGLPCSDDAIVRVGLPDHFDGIGQRSFERKCLFIEFELPALDLGQVEQVDDQVVELANLDEGPLDIQFSRIFRTNGAIEELYIRARMRRKRGLENSSWMAILINSSFFLTACF